MQASKNMQDSLKDTQAIEIWTNVIPKILFNICFDAKKSNCNNKQYEIFWSNSMIFKQVLEKESVTWDCQYGSMHSKWKKMWRNEIWNEFLSQLLK